MTSGKRGCALCLGWGLHVVALTSLVCGMVTPYWSRVTAPVTGQTTQNNGLVVSLTAAGDWEFRDFDQFSHAATNETILYLLLAVVFGLLSIFLQFFVAQAYGFAFHNASCGRKYSPDVLIMFSLLAGLVSITCLALYEQYIGRSVTDAATAAKPGYNMDYSRGFVIIHIALVFVAAFVTICDRTNDKNKKLNDDRDDFARAKGKR